MKTYEIIVKVFTTLVVTAEDEDDALEIAGDVCPSYHGFNLDEMSVDEELKDEDAIQRTIRHSYAHRYDGKKSPYTKDDA